MKKEHKIYIVSEYYYPIVTSTGYYITEIAEFLATSRNNVHVICTNAKYNEKDNIKTPKEEIRNGVHIHRVLSGDIDKNNFFQRVIRLVHSSIGLFFTILFLVDKKDEVLIVTNPAFLILLMPVVKLFKGVKYKIIVHDIFPENLAAIGKVSETSLLYNLLKKAFDFAYARADKCIAIGRDMKEVLADKIGNTSNINVIPNWSDTEDVKPLDKEETLTIKKLELEDKFIFQFAGNLGHAQGLDNIIESIRLVNNKNLHFLFIGSGAMELNIDNFIKTNLHDNVTHIGFQNRSDQEDFLNACDIAIVTLNDGMYGLGVPSKSYNIMATGKPILVVGHEKSEISLCVTEHNLGWVVEPNNPLKLSEAFQDIYREHLNSNFKNKANSREIALKHFSKDIILEKYNDLFND